MKKNVLWACVALFALNAYVSRGLREREYDPTKKMDAFPGTANAWIRPQIFIGNTASSC